MAIKGRPFDGGARLPSRQLERPGAHVIGRPEWESREPAGVALESACEKVARQRWEVVLGQHVCLRIRAAPVDEHRPWVGRADVRNETLGYDVCDANLRRGIDLPREDEILGRERLPIVPGQVGL